MEGPNQEEPALPCCSAKSVRNFRFEISLSKNTSWASMEREWLELLPHEMLLKGGFLKNSIKKTKN